MATWPAVEKKTIESSGERDHRSELGGACAGGVPVERVHGKPAMSRA
jgi:hypothetical protein